MSTEPQEQPKNNATLKVVLDHSYQEQQLRAQLDKANEENTKNVETIKALLVDHKEKFESETNHQGLKLPPVGGESPPLEAPQKQETQLNNLEGSIVPQDFVYGKNTNDVLQKIELLSRSRAENAADYKKILGKLVKKSFSDSKPLDITFVGKNTDFMRSPLPTNENLPLEYQERVKKRNSKLKDNRIAWKVN